MTATFLPCNPACAQDLHTSSPRASFRKTAVLRGESHSNGSSIRVERTTQSQHYNHERYEEQIRQRINAAQRAQNEWYKSIASVAQAHDAIRLQHIAHVKAERDVERAEIHRRERVQLEEHQRWLAEETERRQIEAEQRRREVAEQQAILLAQREAENEARRRRLTEEEGQRRLDDVRRRRVQAEQHAILQAEFEAEIRAQRRRLAEDAERRRIEEEQRRRQEAETEALIQAQIEAQNEERRRQTEEAEQQRRERLRECVVCLESQDMSTMIQVICSHWYCRGHLRGKSFIKLDHHQGYH
ncbi:MAG: hypothetical protein Q9195_004968 [Heterodermia aff. obscurata]